jgi:large subunit ribosomal protein L23
MSIFNKLKKTKAQTNADITQTKADSPRQSAFSPRKSVFSPRQSVSLLIKHAWITEKSTDLSGLRKYVFIVDRKANKSEIKKAIESIYKVKVSGVNIINTKGKQKRLGRSLGKTSAFKKAVVTLKEGEKIDIVPA